MPSWDRRDFGELVHDRREFHPWLANGVSDRFAKNAFARHFLERAALRMPACRDHLRPGDEEAIWAYVEWLRRTPH